MPFCVHHPARLRVFLYSEKISSIDLVKQPKTTIITSSLTL